MVMRHTGHPKKTDSHLVKNMPKSGAKHDVLRLARRLKEFGFDGNQRRWAIANIDLLREREIIYTSEINVSDSRNITAGDNVHLIAVNSTIFGLDSKIHGATVNAIALYLGHDPLVVKGNQLFIVTHFERATTVDMDTKKTMETAYFQFENGLQIISVPKNEIGVSKLRLNAKK